MVYKKITDASNQKRAPAANLTASVATLLDLDSLYVCVNFALHLSPWNQW